LIETAADVVAPVVDVVVALLAGACKCSIEVAE
jgi:hypothetical protein